MRFKENWEGKTGLDFGITELIFERSSAFQKVRIYKTDIFGRLMTLDDLVMVTEADEFVYHEMITHPAMMTLAHPRRVLVIGGGDGGTVREVLRHPSIERVDLVEIDPVVLEASRAHLPTIASALDDPRLKIHVQDGVKFVKDAAVGTYDVVIVDSTDPGGIAGDLFNTDFYRQVHRSLNDDGLVVTQNGESPYDCDYPKTIRRIRKTFQEVFPVVELYTAAIPTYAYGLWSFSVASKRLRPSSDFRPAQAMARTNAFATPLKYYTAALHQAAFALPAFMAPYLEE